MEFIEASAFTRHVHHYLDDDSYSALQAELAADPERGEMVPGSGGFRKVRWPDTRRGKGRRGGLRVIYFYFELEYQIWLMTLYSKNEVADLTSKEKKTLKAAIDLEAKVRVEKRARRKR
ncbi:MAG: toxin [Terriglobia bacterium]|jgi:hypothetical protein